MIAILLAQVIDLASNGAEVAAARQDGVVIDGREVRASIAQVTGVAYAPDGTLALFGGKPGRAGELQLVGKWSVADHEDMVNAVAFGPAPSTPLGASWVATGSHDLSISVRGAADGKVLRKLEGHTAAVLALAASPDGRVLVSAGEDRTIRVWDPATGALKRTIANHHERVGALAFSPDGKYLASGSRDRTVRVWQPEIGRLVRIVRRHEGEVTDIAWADGALASACADGKVRLIDPESDAILRELDAGGYVHAVVVTPREIVAAAGEVKRWPRP